MQVIIETNTTGFGELVVIHLVTKHGFLFCTNDLKRYSQLSLKLASNTVIDYLTLESLEEPIYIWSTSDSGLDKCLELHFPPAFNLYNRNLIKLCRDKLLTRDRLPQFSPQVIRSISTLTKTKEGITDVICKPRNGTGSKDLTYVSKLNESYFEILSSHISKGYVVEEYIPGTEYSAEILLSPSKYSILSVIQKHLTNIPYRLELLHHLAPEVETLHQFLDPLALELCKYTNLSSYLVHIEFKIYKMRLYLIEINPRPCGSLLAWLVVDNPLDLIKIISSSVTDSTVKEVDKVYQSISVAYTCKRCVVSSLTPAMHDQIKHLMRNLHGDVLFECYNSNWIPNSSDFSGRFSTLCLQFSSIRVRDSFVYQFTTEFIQ